jgi:hypothetical protein
MADRVLRGSRLGAVSYENERGQAPAARVRVDFACPQGHRFDIVFAEEADLPGVWDCPTCGAGAFAVDGPTPSMKPVKPVRTHWDMLLERRSVGELQTLLDERLAEIRGDGSHGRRRTA